MKRALSLAGVAALAVALAGCASRSDMSQPAVQESMTVGGALGLTGLILVIPTIVLAIGFFVLGVNWDANDLYRNSWKRTDEQLKIGRYCLYGACGTLAAACFLWIAAIWLSVGS